MTLDPLGDLSLIYYAGNELDEFINMYHQPCIAALFGTSVGSSPDVEAKIFMGYEWLTHEACSMLFCLDDNTRWNRNDFDCIESLITWRKSPIYDSNDIASNIDAEVNQSDSFEPWQYDTTNFQLYQKLLNVCWEDSNPTSRISYYTVANFCIPEIIGEKVDEGIIYPCNNHHDRLVVSICNRNDILLNNYWNKTKVKVKFSTPHK